MSMMKTNGLPSIF
jgi:hypothetical protein